MLPGGGYLPWAFLVDGKAVELDVSGSVTVNDSDLFLSMALEGVGVAYIMEEYVAPMIADGRLVSLFDDGVLPGIPGIFLFYPSRRQNPAALRARIEFLRANVRKAGNGHH